MSEKLCIFCKHFRWSTERAWGMGSTAREIILRGEKCEKYERP